MEKILKHHKLDYLGGGNQGYVFKLENLNTKYGTVKKCMKFIKLDIQKGSELHSNIFEQSGNIGYLNTKKVDKKHKAFIEKLDVQQKTSLKNWDSIVKELERNVFITSLKGKNTSGLPSCLLSYGEQWIERIGEDVFLIFVMDEVSSINEMKISITKEYLKAFKLEFEAKIKNSKILQGFKNSLDVISKQLLKTSYKEKNVQFRNEILNSKKSQFQRIAPGDIFGRLCIEMLNTMKQLHQHQIFHGDLKIDNLGFTNGSIESSRLFFIDFGQTSELTGSDIGKKGKMEEKEYRKKKDVEKLMNLLQNLYKFFFGLTETIKRTIKKSKVEIIKEINQIIEDLQFFKLNRSTQLKLMLILNSSYQTIDQLIADISNEIGLNIIRNIPLRTILDKKFEKLEQENSDLKNGISDLKNTNSDLKNDFHSLLKIFQNPDKNKETFTKLLQKYQNLEQKK